MPELWGATTHCQLIPRQAGIAYMIKTYSFPNKSRTQFSKPITRTTAGEKPVQCKEKGILNRKPLKGEV